MDSNYKFSEISLRFIKIKLDKLFYHINQFGHKRSHPRWDRGGTTPPPPISKYFNKERVPSGNRTHDLSHDSPRRYPLRHKSLDEATHGIYLILS